MSVIESELYALAIIGLLTTVISAFYYLKIIKIIYFDDNKIKFDDVRNVSVKTTIFLCGASITAQYLFTIRELFLIATLFSLYNYLNNSSNKEINYDLSLLMLTTSVGCLWSFDRGLAGLSSVTLGLLVRSYFKKDIKYLKSLLIVLLSTLILILFTKFFGFKSAKISFRIYFGELFLSLISCGIQ